MSLKYGKTEISLMVEAIDQDHPTAEEAAKAALSVAEEIFEKRANFVVVGQLYRTKERSQIPRDDPEAIRLSLGWHSTEGDAIKAAEGLAVGTATGDQFNTMILPVHHGTPADLHKKQKDKYAADDAKRQEKRADKFRDSIAKHREAMLARHAEITAREQAAGGQQWPCTKWTSGPCRHEPTCPSI